MLAAWARRDRSGPTAVACAVRQGETRRRCGWRRGMAIARNGPIPAPVLLSDQLIRPFITKNSVVRVTAAEMALFGGATFQAGLDVNALFRRLCHDYFFDNTITSDPDSPDQQLHRLAGLLL